MRFSMQPQTYFEPVVLNLYLDLATKHSQKIIFTVFLQKAVQVLGSK
eukprot:SAG11_NODE_4827_length_1752_cov_4.010284_1_plen_47_part_00